VADRVEDLLETFIAHYLSQNRSGGKFPSFSAARWESPGRAGVFMNSPNET